MSNMNLNDDELLNAAIGDLDELADKEPIPLSQKSLQKPPIVISQAKTKKRMAIKIIFCVIIIAVFSVFCVNLFNSYNSSQSELSSNESLNNNLIDNDINNEIDFLLHDNINSELNNIEANYLVDGYVPYDKMNQLIEKIKLFAETQKENGNILSYEENHSSIFMTLNDKTVICYTPKIKDTLSNGEEKCRVVCYELAKDDLRKQGLNTKTLELYDKVAKKIATLDKYSLSSNDSLDDESVTLEKVKNLKGASVVLWIGHGAFGDTNHSCLLVNDNYKEYVKSHPEDALCDINTNRTRVVDCDGQILITGEFFDYYFSENDFDGTIFYFCTCHSAEDDFLSNILKSKGAKCIFGTTTVTDVYYGSNMLESIFDNLVKGKTAQESLKIAKRINGNNDSYGSTIRIVGEKDTKLDIDKINKETKSSKDRNITSGLCTTDYQGYADIIDGIEEQDDGMYGTAKFDEDVNFFVNGVVYCTCKDLSNDDIEELMICYGEDEKYYIDVYSTINGSAKKVGTIEATNSRYVDGGAGCYIDCNYSNGVYLVSGTRDFETTFYSFNGTSLIKSDTFSNDSGIEFLINGDSVSKSKYNTERNKYPSDDEFNIVEFYQDNPGDINKEIYNFAQELREK